MKRFNRRVVWAVLICGASLLQVGAAGAIWFGHQDAQRRLVEEQQRIATLQRQLEAQQELTTKGPTAEVVPSRWRLLDGPDVAATMEVVNNLGVEARVTFDTIRASTSNVAGKQMFQVSGHGTPVQVCEFLAAIEQHDRLIIVESGRVVPGGDELIAFDLGLATYHHGGAR